jgi:hypothetical protein
VRAEHAAVALDSANAPYSSGGTDEGSQIASQSMLGDYIFAAPSEDAMAVMSRAHHAVRKKENKRRSLSFLTSFLFNSCEVHSCELSRDLPRQTPDLYRTQNTSPRKIENNNERCCVCLALPCYPTVPRARTRLSSLTVSTASLVAPAVKKWGPGMAPRSNSRLGASRCEQRPFFLNFSYVSPEPVLAK